MISGLLAQIAAYTWVRITLAYPTQVQHMGKLHVSINLEDPVKEPRIRGKHPIEQEE